MSEQLSFDDYVLARKRRVTARDRFLSVMDQNIPWDSLTEMIAPYYYAGKRGRRPYSSETMLRMYLLREWYSLTDGLTEEFIYDSYAFRRFLRLDITREKIPDASTLTKFRRLIAKHHLGKEITRIVNEAFDGCGYIRKRARFTENTVRRVPRPKKK